MHCFQAQLEDILAGGDALRPVYLLGESFGGLMAIALAAQCPFVSDVVPLCVAYLHCLSEFLSYLM